MKFKCKHCKTVNSCPGLYCEFCGKETGFSRKKYATMKSLSETELGKTAVQFPTGDETVRAFTYKKKKAPIIISLVLIFFLLLGGAGVGWYLNLLPFGKNDVNTAVERYYRIVDGRQVETVVPNSTAALTAVNEVKDIFGITNAEVELSELHHTTIDGDHYYRLKQTYQGHDVYGRSIIVETDAEGKVFTIVGNFCPISELSLTPGMQADKANKKMRKYALKEMNYTENSLSITETGLLVYAPSQENALLAYSFALSGTSEDGIHQSHLVLLNAKNGKPLLETETKHSFTMSVEGQKGLHQIEVEGSITDYQFVDTTRNIQVYSTKDTSLSAIEVITSSSSANKAIAADALYYTAKSYDFYQDVLGRHSYDNTGGALTLITDLPDSSHAFDGAASFGSSIVFYPKAASLFHSSAAPDVVAHEFTHLVLDHTVGTPIGEIAPTIIESIADIMGNIIEQTQRETPEETWALGEGMGTAKYEMASPAKNGYPETISNFNPEGSVHENASILSHAAYRMWQGTSFGDFTAEETSITNLDQLGKLWYRAMLLLPQDADFEACGAALVQSSHDMFRNGTLTAPQLSGVLLALESVGIKADYPTYYTTGSPSLLVYDAIDALYPEVRISILNLSTYQTTESSNLKLSLSDGEYLVTVSHPEDQTLPSYTVKIVVGETGDTEVPIHTWYNAKDYIDLVHGDEISFTGKVVGENRTDENGETKLAWVLALSEPASIRFMNESGHAESIYNDQVAIALTSDTVDFSLYSFQDVRVTGTLVPKYSDIHLRDLVLENVTIISDTTPVE